VKCACVNHTHRQYWTGFHCNVPYLDGEIIASDNVAPIGCEFDIRNGGHDFRKEGFLRRILFDFKRCRIRTTHMHDDQIEGARRDTAQGNQQGGDSPIAHEHDGGADDPYKTGSVLVACDVRAPQLRVRQRPHPHVYLWCDDHTMRDRGGH
jgi:hypothetical protein